MIFVMSLSHCTICLTGKKLFFVNGAIKVSPLVTYLIQLFLGSFISILQNRWQYFYKSQVLRGFSPGASDQPIPIEDQPDHAHQLLAILTAYGQALYQIIDPHITSRVLTSLLSLHERWKLFDRQFFKTNLLTSFLETLLTVLVSPNGVLHYDQLINVLFSMSQADTKALESAFVARGYVHGSEFINEICLAKVNRRFH